MSKSKKPVTKAEEAVKDLPAEDLPEMSAAPEPEQVEKAPEKPAQEPVVYLGPTIPRLVSHGTVFSGGIPAYITKRMEKIPAMKGLFLPVSEYAEGERALRTEGRLKTLYTLVKKSI